MNPLNESHFTNRHGERWKFIYDPSSERALVTGSDVGGESYPVVEGAAFSLHLQEDEKIWLKNAWITFCGDLPCASLYLGKDTELVLGPSHCWLSNAYCPVCLGQKEEFEIHHCIAASDGGSDSPSNMLSICKSCHALITNGGVEERFPKHKAALNHQLMVFGMRTLHDSMANRSKRSQSGFVDRFPNMTEFANRLRELSPAQIEHQNSLFKVESRIQYQFSRDVGLGKWPWPQYNNLLGFKRAISLDVS